LIEILLITDKFSNPIQITIKFANKTSTPRIDSQNNTEPSHGISKITSIKTKKLFTNSAKHRLKSNRRILKAKF